MPIMPVYRKSNEQVIASYNYTDIAEGTGIIELYGGTQKVTTTESYYISSDDDVSFNVSTTGRTTSDTGVFQKILDIDFDLAPFNLPKNLKGRLRCIANLFIGKENDANEHGEAYIIMKLRKWDGSTETEIGNAQSSTAANPTSLIKTPYLLNWYYDIASSTHFKKGETLRITLEVWIDPVDHANCNVELYHDPKNTTVTTDGGTARTTQLIFKVPFVIDL